MSREEILYITFFIAQFIFIAPIVISYYFDNPDSNALIFGLVGLGYSILNLTLFLRLEEKRYD